MSSMWHHFQAGGWAMWIILFWLICSIAVIAERAVYLFGSSINKEVFLATMQKCILAGDIAKAVKMCSAANAPLARIVQAGAIPIDTLAVISELQQTWNRPDALDYANIFADHMMPNYRLLMESYEKAQRVQREGHETKLDRVDAGPVGKRGMQPAGMER